jgi:hypothetical protein
MHCCNLLDYYLNKCEDVIVRRSKSCDEYGVVVPGDESSYILMNYCPWCGNVFPKSKRNLWVDIIEELGYDGIFDENIPEILKTDEWYKNLPNVDNMTDQEVIKTLKLSPKKQ